MTERDGEIRPWYGVGEEDKKGEEGEVEGELNTHSGLKTGPSTRLPPVGQTPQGE